VTRSGLQVLARVQLVCGGLRSRCLNDRLDSNVALVFGVAIPPERSNDEQNYEALHMFDQW